MPKRFVVDKSSGEHLVFPDVLKIDLQIGEEEEGLVSLSMSARLTAGSDLSNLPKAREIALTSPFFILRRPSDEAVKEFQFVRSDGLAGNAVLLVDAGHADAVVSRIQSDPTYFDPEYSGTSEPFDSLVEIASVSLDEHQVQTVRVQSSLANQFNKLFELVRDGVDDADRPHALDLVDKLLVQGDFERRDEVWWLVISPGALKADLTKIEETVLQVSGLTKDISM